MNTFQKGNVDTIFKQLDEYFRLLNDLNDPIKINESQEAYMSIKYMRLQLAKQPSNLKIKIIELIIKSNVHVILSNLFDYLYSIRLEININESRAISKSKYYNQYYVTTSLNERRLFNLFELDNLFRKMFSLSLDFRRFYTNENKIYLKCYIDFINDLDFIQKCMQFNPDFDGFINGLQNLSVNADECKQQWQKLNSVNVLLRFAREINKFCIEAYCIIACIASDNEIEQITELNQVIIKIIQLTVKCIINPTDTHNQQFKDTIGNSDETGNYFALKAVSLGNGFVLSIDAFLICLFGFAVNEKCKLDIFKADKFYESIKILILTGIEVEKHFALQLLSQLAFNKQINKELNKDYELLDYIQKLKNQQVFEFKKLQKTCNDLIWLLSNSDNEKSKDESKNKEKQNHIMISYNTVSRVTCLKIKNELEKMNWKVWM